MEKILYERELYEPLRQYLIDNGFEVRAEVNKCDLVARKLDHIIIIEMKRHLSFDLLAQAVERQSYADEVYLCVPKPSGFKLDKTWRAKMKVLRQLGLGLLLVARIGQNHTVEEALPPAPEEGKPMRTSNKKRQALVKEFGSRSLDLNVGGTHGVPLVTAYRETALYLVFLLDTHGPLTPKSLRSLGAHPKKTTSILNANYYDWFRKTPEKCYELTDAGIKAMTAYAPLINAFREAEKAKTDLL